MFIDQARIHLKAGDGGRGCVSFRREKFVPRGGPDGGDGGTGGSIHLKATSKKNTLLDFRYKRHFKAERGRHGEGSNRTGKSGVDLWIDVPRGTIIRDAESNELLADLNEEGSTFLAARGGRGGRGNAHFVTATAQAPEYAQDGEKGVERDLELELKLLADVGLVGFPNAGKSTLLSRISSAKPKIASYPFTTLEPLLGTVKIDDHTTVVVADIPGLIEGASEGHGLGLQFLRHIERTKVLLHLIDVSAEPQLEPVKAYQVIQKELEEYERQLNKKPQIIVATKLDVVDEKRLASLKKMAARKELPFVAISAITGEGLPDLHYAIKRQL
ncbi:MAG: GTPase ObgE [Acidobacteria bacterium]|nr:MAG: GTPase ObgE [Acidobacteriota bacterium]